MAWPRRRWFDRKFTLGLPPEDFPEIVERLRGTPARLEEHLHTVPPAELVRHEEGQWSAQEHAGHLLDLEPLWAGRLDELLIGAQVLRPADLENRTTKEAGHNSRALVELLAEFRAERSAFVARLERLPAAALRQTALHPRLRQPMSVVDLCFFVAEHDDHHLATITALLGS